MITVVVPVFNEDEGIHLFFSELLIVLKKLKSEYEIIFIDDGSTDKTLDRLHELERTHPHVKIYSFRKNQGKAEALTFGFQKAEGDVIVTLDADLQDQPSEIPMLLAELEHEWDVVSGWRKNRKDSLKKVISSKLFNLLARTFWGLQLHDYNCGLKAYTSATAKSLRLYGGLHRFIPLLAFEKGFSVTEVAVQHQERQFGTSKYGFSKVFKDLPDIFTMLFLARYGKRPLHFFGLIGGGMLFVGFLILSYLSILRFLGETIGDRPLLLFGVLIFLAGMQIFFTGFLAELVINLSQREYRPYPLKYSSDKKK